ncbi:cation:dicarboxylate symporter family transporter [Gemella cuniculi]|uniref:cation:dicarboxylate symporter family transporter n=1 Tax=Gemella cuniculi TaxID=150240 RepID=UPI00040CB14E|nr:cation:dicarboxylase symporter family transporter [Gemella cuniculi]
MGNNFTFFEKFLMISTKETLLFLVILFALFYFMYYLAKKRVSSTKRTLLATVIGLLLGVIIQVYSGFNDTPMNIKYIAEITKWYSLFGNGFIDLIKMLIIPLVLVSIINVIVNINYNTDVKKMTRLTLTVTLGMVAISSIIGFFISAIFKLGNNSIALGSGDSKIKEVKDVVTILRELIPSNPVKAMTDFNIIGIVIFAMFIGIAARYVQNKNEQKVKSFVDYIASLHVIVSRITIMVIKLLPYAVIPLLANTIAQRGLKSIKDVLLFIVLLYLAIIIQFIVQAIFLAIHGLSPITYFKKASKPLILAFTSRSSAGTLPLTINTLTKEMGVNQSTANFVASFSSTAGMQGCAGIYPTMLIVFLANANGIGIDITLFLMTIIVVTLGSVGIAGVPGTAITAASVSVNGVGFGALFNQINPILAVDPILDMGRTCLNVSGGMTNSIMVDKYLKSFNKNDFENFNEKNE